MKRNLKMLLGFGGVIVVVVAMLLIPSFIESGIPDVCMSGGECQHQSYVETIISLVPVLIGLGAIIGALAIYLFYEKAAAPSSNKGAALSLMEKDERAVVGRIVEEGGRITQSEISLIKGLGKVKAHRILERLEKRGILEREQYGKTNMVKLAGRYRSLFFGDE